MVHATGLLDQKKSPPRLDLAEAAFAAHKAGKGFGGQIADIVRLRRGPGRLRPHEYYLFRLYEDQRLTPEAKLAYVGERRQFQLITDLCRNDWRTVSHDKLVYYLLLAGLGLRVPRVLAIHHAFRVHPGAAALRTNDDVAAFLRTAQYPLFGKPVTGMYSVGTVALDAYDSASDSVRTKDGRTANLASFAAELKPFERWGYLFQETLRPHPAVRAMIGERIATVRMVVLLDDGGPELLRALWKVPVGAHVADNFWRDGNMLAALDPADGRIARVVRGVGHRQTEVTSHPDTGHELVGQHLPDWHAATALCLGAAASLPGLAMQAWDVALTAEGPLLLEVNNGGDFNLPQHAFGQGLYQGRLREFAERRGVPL